MVGARSHAAAWLIVLSLGAACSNTTPRADDGLGIHDAGPLTPACTIDASLDVLETEELTHVITCRDGEALPEDIALAALPDGASFDSEAATLRWIPGLDQAAHYDVEVRAGRNALGVLRIDVIDNFVSPDNVPLANPERYTSEYGLPVLHLGVSPNINDDTHEPATVVYRGHRFIGATAKYRGATSRSYPKRSYTLGFDKADPFVDEGRGFPGGRRIVLTTTFDDNSYLRQRLAYELWNRVSDENIAIHAYNAVVFLDGTYAGLYVVSDHVDDDFLEGAGMFGHGNLYKARLHAANFRLVKPNGRAKSTLHEGYTKEEGFPADPDPAAYDDLDALVRWIATASDSEFGEEFEQRMVRSDFEGWLMFVYLIQATDSAGKNSFLYHDAREGALEPRWRYLPWDFNASFGQGYRTQRRPATAHALPDFSKYNELFARLLRDEALRSRVMGRLREALAGVWQRDVVLELFDSWVSEIGASALRDEQMWGTPFRDFGWGGRTDWTTYSEEVNFVRDWIRERWGFADEAL